MLITRCPNCETTFRVRMEQLNLRAGRVRCGHCHVPFSALGSLEEVPDDSALPQRPTPQPAVQVPVAETAPVITAPAEVVVPVAAAPVAIDPIELAPTPLALAPTVDPIDHEATIAATQIVPLDDETEDESDEGLSLAFDTDFETADAAHAAIEEAKQASAALQNGAPENISEAHDAPAEVTSDDIPDDADKEFIDLGSAIDDAEAEEFDREFERNLEASDDTEDTSINLNEADDGDDDMPQLHTVFLDEDIPHGASADPALLAAKRKTRRILVLGNVLLLLTGLLLSTYILRVELTRLHPGLRAPLEQACQYFACDVPYPRDADEVLLVGSDLTQAKDTAGGYHLAVTVRNHAQYPVAWPQLEITLTDRYERALTRRVLEPAEWLPASVAQQTAFEGQGEITSQITLTSDAQVMGYRLGVFYR